MEVVVVYRGRVRAPREARVVFWEGVRSGLGWQEAAVAAGVPRGGAVWVRAGGEGEGGGAGERAVPVGGGAGGERGGAGGRGRRAGDRGAAGPGAVDGEPGGAQELPVPGPVPGDGGAAAGGGPGAAAEGG